MISNYLKIAWRGLVKNKLSAAINIGGLAVGMAVALLISLWIQDELTFDHYHENYGSIVQVIQNQTMNGEISTDRSMPLPLGYQLRRDFKNEFKYAVLMHPGEYVLSAGNKKLNTQGIYMQPEGPEMLTYHMLHGSRKALNDPTSLMLSASMAKSLFGAADPMDQIVKIDDKYIVKVRGVYEDLPRNTTLAEFSGFAAPWDLYMTTARYLKENINWWGNNSWAVIAQLQPGANPDIVNRDIRDLKMKGMAAGGDKVGMAFKAQLFIDPMSNWHLYADFKNGKIAGGDIKFVWMFGLVGVFVLLLACINFMNLSTARSEKRALEVGVRKAVGSMRSQLIIQFFTESMLLAVLAFVICLLLAQLSLLEFNEVADKTITIPYGNPLFWLSGLALTVFTGVIAGSYPALYLSGFNPVKVLKGTFRVGRFAAVPRKALIVVQFAFSVMLIIGTIAVYMQINYSKNRPVGYNRDGLLQVNLKNPAISDHFSALRQEMINSGAAADVAGSDSPITDVWSNYSDISWPGKPANFQDNFGMIAINPEYGHTIGWKLVDGRDFSHDYLADSSAMIINESAMHFMNLKNPVGQTIRWNKNYTIIGVVKDVVMSSPYEPVKPTLFRFASQVGVLNIRINPKMSASAALPLLQKLFNKYDPATPFDYKFTSTEFGKKFALEERVGSLSLVFTVLAIFISCLGLFGMASFMAEQRKKEIGVRKVLGASVAGLWRLLSIEFVVLVAISFFIAMPLAYYVMHRWLMGYNYRISLSWWVFVATGIGALALTLITVSYQSIRAASANPAESLKTE